MRASRLAALLLAAASSTARGAPWPDDGERALPCRPTIACTAELVPAGRVELEVGYLFRRLGGATLQHGTPALLKLSVTDWAQLQVETNGYTYATAPVATRFVDDIAVGVKLRLAKQDGLFPALSWSALVSIPLGAQPGYVRTWDAFLTAYLTKEVWRLHFDLNLAINLWRLERPVLIQPWIALATSMELPRRFSAMIEFYYFTDAAPVAPRDGGVLAAIAYAAKPWLIVDAGADVGLVQEQRAVSAFAGMTIVPLVLWGKRRR